MLLPLPEGPTTATISRGFDLAGSSPRSATVSVGAGAEDLEDVEQLERRRLGVVGGRSGST